MVSDDERRLVAEGLRMSDERDAAGFDCLLAEVVRGREFCETPCEECRARLLDELADLIEPSEPKVKCVAEVKFDGERLEKLAHDAAVELTGIDRDALLAVAETLEDCAGRDSDLTTLGYSCLAKRIREALGVSDG